MLCGSLEKSVSWNLSGEKIHGTRTLDRIRDPAVKLCRNTGHPARQNLASLSGELGEKFRIGENHLVRRDVMTTTRHLPVRLAEIDTTLNGFGLRHGKI